MDPHPRRRLESAALRTVNYGDSAVLVWAESPDPLERWQLVHRLSETLAETKPMGLIGSIATFETVLVEFDCITTSHREIVAAIAAALGLLRQVPVESRRVFSVPVVYGGDSGPDLAAVAAELGVSESAVVGAHSGAEHVIRCVVSPPGAPMTDLPSLPEPVRRRPGPRSYVPAGSVALAGRQAIIYATASPGGWRIIGRTPARLFDPTMDPPVGYVPGDRLRFFPVPADAWAALSGQPIGFTDG